MAAAAVATTAVTIADKLGIKLPSFGGIFGGKEPNAGSQSWVDALDNFENISTSQARSLETTVTNLILKGAPDAQIAGAIADAGGYTTDQILSSWKWDIVKNWITETKMIIQQNNIEPAQNSTAVNPGQNTWKKYALYGAGILGAIAIGAVLIRRG